MIAVFVGVFGLGYVCGSLTQRPDWWTIGKRGEDGWPGWFNRRIRFFNHRDARPYQWPAKKSWHV